MFNRWKPYPKHKPEERGWYQCSIRYGEEKDQAYVMDLWWDDKKEIWRDNRRLDVFNSYDVYGYGDFTDALSRQMKKLLHKDNLCERDDVIAFKKLPKIYR